MPKTREARYRDLACEQFIAPNYARPRLSREQFWAMIARFGWTENPDDSTPEQARARARLSLREIAALRVMFDRTSAALADSTAAAIPGTDPDELLAAAEHVVALGRERYEVVAASPATLVERERSRGYRVDVGDCFGHEAWVADAGLAELDAALREGSTIRGVDDPAGYGRCELIDHPEHGLGFVVVDRLTTRVDWCFLDFEQQGRRHDRPERSITLYCDDDEADDEPRPRYWYASIGGTGATLDVYVCEGSLGHFGQRRWFVPEPRAQAYERFEALIADARARGFAPWTREHERVRIALQLRDCGLAREPEHRREVLARATRALVETANGSFEGSLHVSRSITTMFFSAIDQSRAAESITEAVETVEGTTSRPTLTTIRADAAPSIQWGPTGPCEELELEHPYYAKLTITPDVETDAAALALACDARARWELDGSLATLSRIDAVLDAALARGEDADELATLLGAYVGEAVRSGIGGRWGIGSLDSCRGFGDAPKHPPQNASHSGGPPSPTCDPSGRQSGYSETAPFGLLLGDQRLRWWPMRDVRERLAGRLGSPLSIRCHRVAQRARSHAELPASADRLFRLAPHQGHFDAGLTADGRQILMAARYTGTFAYTFDHCGRLLEYMRRPELPGRPVGQGEHGPSRMALEAWQRELGFRPQTIEIRAFCGVDEQVGIALLPSHYVDSLENPDSRERERTLAEIKRWLDSGEFVLSWGNELWLDRDGQVTST